MEFDSNTTILFSVLQILVGGIMAVIGILVVYQRGAANSAAPQVAVPDAYTSKVAHLDSIHQADMELEG